MNRTAPAPAGPVRARLLAPLERFFQIAASSGVILLTATLAALLWANSPWSAAYENLWRVPLTVGAGELAVTRPLHFWINEGLMAVFLLVVGLEIRREMHEGALSDLRGAALPLFAALGGVAAPAAIYLALNVGTELSRGWAVPTATDIAFAIGVLALLGERVPSSLRVLLLAIAVIDDIAAILIIAFFYVEGVSAGGLALAIGGILGVLALQRLKVQHAPVYVLPGLVVWVGLLNAGLHPALTGVILGLMTPVKPSEDPAALLARAAQALASLSARAGRSGADPRRLSRPAQLLRSAGREVLPPVVRIELALHPWVAFGVMPLFALANAGVNLAGLEYRPGATIPLAAGIAGGLLIGKPLGIVATVIACLRLGWCALPAGVGIRGLLVLGCLCGIGFTMSIFICGLAFPENALLPTAKLTVLAASGAAAIAGLLLGFRLLRRPAPAAASAC